MRPGPATRTALFFSEYSETRVHARGMGEFIFDRHSEEYLYRCTRQIAICEANFANQSAALWWPAASPAVCGGLFEEAATPGQPVARRSAFWRNPPSNSPSRITRNRRLCRNALAGPTEHLARMSTTVRPASPPHQAKIHARLCRNCGCRRFFVEVRGKSGRWYPKPARLVAGRPPAFDFTPPLSGNDA